MWENCLNQIDCMFLWWQSQTQNVGGGGGGAALSPPFFVRANVQTSRSYENAFFFLRLNKFKECNVSSQATAWFKK